MIFFALIALITALSTLYLDKIMVKERLPKKIRITIIIVLPLITLALYLYLGNLIFV